MRMLSFSQPKAPAGLAGIAALIGPVFAGRAEAADEEDRFVAENYRDLKQHGLISAGVPADLGGGGATHAQLAQTLRELAYYDGSTALALSMHTHQVLVAAWRREHQKAPTDGLLKKVAEKNIVLVSSGGSDWLPGSGTATKVEGGFCINARKVFASGSPAGDLLLTTAVYQDPEAGPTVLHFALPMSELKIDPTWRSLGMRGTGSHDLVIDNVFVADAAISGRRAVGKWHPVMHIVTMIAFPIVYGVYLGVAEKARDLAVQHLRQRGANPFSLQTLGALENELAAARMAWQSMLEAAASNAPGPETSNAVFTGRALVARSVLRAVELAMEACGGASFYRGAGLERCFRDVQGARFHPLQDAPQRLFAGRMALGLDIDG